VKSASFNKVLLNIALRKVCPVKLGPGQVGFGEYGVLHRGIDKHLLAHKRAIVQQAFKPHAEHKISAIRKIDALQLAILMHQTTSAMQSIKLHLHLCINPESTSFQDFFYSIGFSPSLFIKPSAFPWSIKKDLVLLKSDKINPKTD
jgi:hypothetical protein